MASDVSRAIEDYAVVGDMETLAVIARNGDIDWFCWPRFDSPSLFGALLDQDGGRWSLHPVDCDREDRATEGRQLYLSGTNVLVTRFHSDDAVVEVEDFMAVGDGPRRLLRRVRCSRGSVAMTTAISLRPDYGRGSTEPVVDGSTVTFDVDGESLAVTVTGSDGIEVDFAIEDGDVRTNFSIADEQIVTFSFGPTGHDQPGDGSHEDPGLDDEEEYRATVGFWNDWTNRSTYRGRWREAVERSALALKLLTHGPTGGILAAGTTSVPEVIGGGRNWDYRYVWIRDAAFSIYALLELGHVDEARAFTSWLLDRLDETEAAGEGPPLAPLYDLDGNTDLDEIELDHWSGYRDSAPVRIGNAASGQTQLDVYGELIDSLYLADKHGDGLSLAAWRQISTLVEWVIDHWRDADDGMWEARREPQRYTSSLLMCWVAVERAMRMAHQRGRPAPLDRWRTARDEMHATLIDEGWNDEIGAFTQVLGGDSLDASILLAPLVKFIPGTDPKWQSTLDLIGERLAHGPLVDRYDVTQYADGLDGDEGSFTICSFWYVEATARAGRVDEARRMFDRLLTYASPTGLFSEEIGPDGRQLGNFPQAFTHLALISAATLLDELLDTQN